MTLTRRSLLVLGTGATCMLISTSVAQKAAGSKTPDRNLLGEEHAKKLLLLMDPDKNGKVSKQEWMRFMEAEFDRLDKEKRGAVDPKQLLQPAAEISQPSFSKAGK